MVDDTVSRWMWWGLGWSLGVACLAALGLVGWSFYRSAEMRREHARHEADFKGDKTAMILRRRASLVAMRVELSTKYRRATEGAQWQRALEVASIWERLGGRDIELPDLDRVRLRRASEVVERARRRAHDRVKAN